MTSPLLICKGEAKANAKDAAEAAGAAEAAAAAAAASSVAAQAAIGAAASSSMAAKMAAEVTTGKAQQVLETLVAEAAVGVNTAALATQQMDARVATHAALALKSFEAVQSTALEAAAAEAQTLAALDMALMEAAESTRVREKCLGPGEALHADSSLAIGAHHGARSSPQVRHSMLTRAWPRPRRRRQPRNAPSWPPRPRSRSSRLSKCPRSSLARRTRTHRRRSREATSACN